MSFRLSSEDEWKDVHTTVPFVIPKVAQSWPASLWTDHDLIENLPGTYFVRFASRTHDIGKPRFDITCDKYKLTVKEFLDWRTVPSSVLPPIESHWGYMDYLHLVEHESLKPAAAAFHWQSILGQDYSDVEPTVWFGTTGAHSPLHYDTMGWNLHAQIRGSKLWILVPPGGPTVEEAKARHELLGANRNPFENTTVYSDFDVLGDPSILSGIEGVRVFILQPGDVLFVPPLWWHAVCCVDTESAPSTLSFSCNIWLSERPDILNTICEPLTEGWLEVRDEEEDACLDKIMVMIQDFRDLLASESKSTDDDMIKSFRDHIHKLRRNGRQRYDDFQSRYSNLTVTSTSTAAELAKIERALMGLTMVPAFSPIIDRRALRPWDIIDLVKQFF